MQAMAVVVIFLVGLLGFGLYLAVRELSGSRPDPEWNDLAKLRIRLETDLPDAPGPWSSQPSQIRACCFSLHREFLMAWRLCRFLAPIAGDPGYASALVVMSLRFHRDLALALTCSVIGARTPCGRCVQRLRDLSASMRISPLGVPDHADLQASGSAA